MRIVVANLPVQVSEKELQRLFADFGEVTGGTVVPSGEAPYGFVEMPSDAEGHAAIAALNGRIVYGRAIRVEDATEVPIES